MPVLLPNSDVMLLAIHSFVEEMLLVPLERQTLFEPQYEDFVSW
jgi:hypothetical protein